LPVVFSLFILGCLYFIVMALPKMLHTELANTKRIVTDANPALM
jgi:hypothetical protein